MENDINNIISNLTAEDMEMLKGVASSILGGSNSQNSAKTPDSAPVSAQSGTTSLTDNLGLNKSDFDMIMKAKQIFDKMNNTPNKNADLILALKPHLRPETQNKADQAMKILRLFEVLPLLRELF